jgi:hypothetical protein
MTTVIEWNDINEKLPDDSGYYLCWSVERPIIAWFCANKRRFETKKPVGYWSPVNSPNVFS